MKKPFGQMQLLNELEAVPEVVEPVMFLTQRVQLSMPYDALYFPISQLEHDVAVNVFPGEQVQDDFAD